MQNYEEMSREEIIRFLNHENTCILSLSDNNEPHAMPMYFRFSSNDDELTFYFKNLNSERKMDWLKNNNKVHILLYSQGWGELESISAVGTATIIEPSETNHNDIEVKVTEFTGKRYYSY